MSACTSFLASRSPSDKSTPQKLFCSAKDSTPACSSLEATCRVHAIRNFAFFDPRCKLMIIPGCNCVRRAASRAPVWVMSIVCARWVTSSIETLTDNTIFLRDDLRFSSMDNNYHLPTSRGKVTGVTTSIGKQVHSRKMDVRIANSLAYISTSLLRALEVSDLERRLEALEQAQKSEEGGYIEAKGTRGTARVSKQGANGRTFSRNLPVLSG